MREALEYWDGGISIGGRMITNLKYADDTTLIAENKNDLIEIMERVKLVSEKAYLYLNIEEEEEDILFRHLRHLNN